MTQDYKVNVVYWKNICALNEAQEKKGLETYGQRLEDNTKIKAIDRITMRQEEAIDSLKYDEHLKEFLRDLKFRMGLNINAIRVLLEDDEFKKIQGIVEEMITILEEI